MTTDRELMQQALDALKHCYDVQEYPANGTTSQDAAITSLKSRLSAEPSPAERNQCDGCQAGMPTRGRIHIDDAGHAVMSCQRERYAAPPVATPPTEQPFGDSEGLAAAPAGQPEADDPLDTPLPCRVDLGGMSFGKGVRLRTLVQAARRWREDAYGPLPTPEEAGHNLAVLQGRAEPAAAPQSGPSPRAEFEALALRKGFAERQLLRDRNDYEDDNASIAWHWFQWSRDALATSQATEQPADPTDPGHDVATLREHVRHLERRIRQLHEQPADRAQRNELPPLPEPDFTLDGGNLLCFTADQMHEYARAALARKGD